MKTAESLEKNDVVVLARYTYQPKEAHNRLYLVISHDAIHHRIALKLIGETRYPHSQRYLQMTYSEFDADGQYVGKRPGWPARLFRRYV